MNFQHQRDERLFILDGCSLNGVCVVIVDDCSISVANGQLDSGDTRFVAAVIEGLLSSESVGQIILADFDFEFEWISADLRDNSVFLVDMFASANKDPRGLEVLRKLTAYVSQSQIAILSKATGSELVECLGASSNYTKIEKALDAVGEPFRPEYLWPLVVRNVLDFVESRCNDPYVSAVACWNRIAREQLNWLGKGPLFPSGIKHDITWWIDHAYDDENRASLEHGRRALQELSGTEFLLSAIGVFTGLKGMWDSRLGLRLLCEAAGVSSNTLDRFGIDFQLLAPRSVAIDAKALFGLGNLVQGSPGTPWSLTVESLSSFELVLVGHTQFLNDEAAERASATLTSGPLDRQARERKRIGRPGNGVYATEMIRMRAETIAFSRNRNILNVRMLFQLLGRLG